MLFKGKFRFMMMRHGESIWNKNSTFTGWTDIHLTQNGKMEAFNAAQKLKHLNINPSVIHTSSLYRAINTSEIINKHFHVPILYFMATQRKTLWHFRRSPARIYP